VNRELLSYLVIPEGKNELNKWLRWSNRISEMVSKEVIIGFPLRKFVDQTEPLAKNSAPLAKTVS